MLTAKLFTYAFSIVCPWCQEKVKNTHDDSLLHTTDTTEPGQVMRCTNDECKQSFRLPKSLKAEAE